MTLKHPMSRSQPPDIGRQLRATMLAALAVGLIFGWIPASLAETAPGGAGQPPAAADTHPAAETKAGDDPVVPATAGSHLIPQSDAPPAAPASSGAAEAGTGTGASAGPAAGTTAPAEAPKAEAPPPPPEPTLVADINLSTQWMTVTVNGAVKYTWAISSARQGYKTPTGTFKPTWMSRMWYSRQYDYAPMPHAVFFSGGTAVHATYAVRQLGSPASHGCVRLAPANAATFYKLVGQHGKDMTRIRVHGAPKALPAVAERANRRARTAAQSPRYRYAPGYYGGPGPGYATPSRYYKPRRYVQRNYYYSPY
jgi:lipoprotein-anchoring transpeptidase ErfK/SrfK